MRTRVRFFVDGTGEDISWDGARSEPSLSYRSVRSMTRQGDSPADVVAASVAAWYRSATAAIAAFAPPVLPDLEHVRPIGEFGSKS